MGTILMILGILFLVLVIAVVSAIFFFTSLVKKIGEKANERSVKIASGASGPDFFEDLSQFPIIRNIFGQQLASLKDAALYCNNTIPQIVQEWNPEELTTRSTDHLLNSFESGKLEADFALHSENLGQLTTYKGIKTAYLSNYFITEAIFARGLAQVTIGLIQNEDTWLIEQFRVDYIFPEQSTTEESLDAESI